MSFGEDFGYAYCFNKEYIDNIDVEQNARENNLTTKELTAIANYVRTNFNNKSLYEFLTKDLGVKANFNKNAYMIVSDKISVSKTRNEGLDKCFNDDYDYSALGVQLHSVARIF